MFIKDPDPNFISIPDPGVKKKNRIPDSDPQHWFSDAFLFRLATTIFLVFFGKYDWSHFLPLASWITLRTLPSSLVYRRLSPPNPRQRQQNRRRPTGTPTPPTQVTQPLFYSIDVMDLEQFGSVFRIRILMRSSDSGSGSCSFRERL
jgi:hypothetical protein